MEETAGMQAEGSLPDMGSGAQANEPIGTAHHEDTVGAKFKVQRPSGVS